MEETQTAVGETSDPTVPGNRPARVLGEGDHLGRYVVLRRQGAGAMGTVYAAWDPELDRQVAVKVMHPVGNDELTRKRLIREAQAIAQISHPNVVAVFDVGTVDDDVFVAMEFVEGRTLRQWQATSPPWRKAVEILSQAGLGLAAAHAEKLVHRDFKPDNVIIGKDDRVRVLDFGLARGIQDVVDVPGAGGHVRSLDGTMTQAGTSAGTPAYMAPEQYLGVGVGPASDQFAFCVVLHETLYGRRPFAGKTPVELATAVMEGRRVDVGRTEVPQWLHQHIVRGLSPRPEDRFPSMDSLIEAIHRDPTGKRRALIGAGAVLVVLASIPFGYQGYRSQVRATCERDSRLAEVWGQSPRAELAELYAARSRGGGAEDFKRLVPWFDRFAERWEAASERACVDARLERGADPVDSARAAICLDERRTQFETMVARSTEGAELASLIRMAAGLRSPERCLEPEFLARQYPSVTASKPSDVEQRTRATLSRASASFQLGDTDATLIALDEAHEFLEDERLSQRHDLRASMRLLRARVKQRLGNLDDAEAAYAESFRFALGTGEDDVALRSALPLVWVIAQHEARSEEALRWADICESLFTRLGEPEPSPRRAGLLIDRAIVADRRGDHALGLELARKAVAMQEAALGPNDPELAMALNSLGVSLWRAGQLDDARAQLERAVEIWSSTYGPLHLYLGLAYGNLGIIAYTEGDYGAALGRFEQAVDVAERDGAGNNVSASNHRNNAAEASLALGRPAQALVHARRATEVRAASLGPGDVRTLEARVNVGTALRQLGEFAEAQHVLEETLDSLSEAGGQAIMVARAQFDLAVALHEQQLEPHRVRELLEHARPVLADSGDHPDELKRCDELLVLER